MRIFSEFMEDGKQTEIRCHLKLSKETCPNRQMGGSQAVGASPCSQCPAGLSVLDL